MSYCEMNDCAMHYTGEQNSIYVHTYNYILQTYQYEYIRQFAWIFYNRSRSQVTKPYLQCCLSALSPCTRTSCLLSIPCHWSRSFVGSLSSPWLLHRPMSQVPPDWRMLLLFGVQVEMVDTQVSSSIGNCHPSLKYADASPTSWIFMLTSCDQWKTQPFSIFPT